jgi:two-component system, NarL family, response regulator
MTPDRIRVLCVDDHPIVTEGISAIINRQPDMVVVASADSVDGAIKQFRSERPDVTLMDLQLRDDNGVDAIHVIHEESPGARIVVLTVHQGDEDIFRALEAGAVAYLLKEEVPDDLVRIIRQVYSGEVPPMRPDLKERLAKRGTTPVLTAREIQVLHLVSQGLRNKEIAAVLGISDETARVHVKNILAKLEVNDRSAAVNVGIRRGIIHLGH